VRSHQTINPKYIPLTCGLINPQNDLVCLLDRRWKDVMKKHVIFFFIRFYHSKIIEHKRSNISVIMTYSHFIDWNLFKWMMMNSNPVQSRWILKNGFVNWIMNNDEELNCQSCLTLNCCLTYLEKWIQSKIVWLLRLKHCYYSFLPCLISTFRLAIEFPFILFVEWFDAVFICWFTILLTCFP